ncbi:MAG: tripartite tricarboxylate transporter substrate binding protein [Burkholderiaceae bacterium]|nr:tripartite tricarboxylate transporter substrate binding protein [Burkholderiaceae bacterium]
MHALFRSAKTLLATSLVALAATASAQSYPHRPIEWVVPYPAGGGTDIVARTLGQAMGATLGQSIVINNKPGAATNIGAEYVARAKPDGYTLMSADTATLAANPFIYSKLSYNVEKDFAPVGLTVRFPMILVVNPSVPAKNLAELTAWIKTQNGANYATPGAGSPHHLATELFREVTKVTLTHVPYRGAAPAVQDVVAGQVPFMFVDTASGNQFITAGKLRPIGVASPQRVKNFETIPTLAEQGLKGFEAYAWQGLVMPAGTPDEIVQKVNKALLAAMDTTAVKARLQALGLESIPSNPQQMADYAARERAKWGKVIQANGIKAD